MVPLSSAASNAGAAGVTGGVARIVRLKAALGALEVPGDVLNLCSQGVGTVAQGAGQLHGVRCNGAEARRPQHVVAGINESGAVLARRRNPPRTGWRTFVIPSPSTPLSLAASKAGGRQCRRWRGADGDRGRQA